MSLFTVSFTTQVLVTKIGDKNKVIGKSRMDKPVTITALPHATAMSYSKCDNFKIVPYEMEPRRSSKGSGRDASVGNGTKKSSYVRGEADFSRGQSQTQAQAAGRSKIADAAASGNLAAAINA